MRHADRVAFTDTDEQHALRAAVADLMAKRSSEHQVRELMATDTGYDTVVWQELADMALPGLLIAEDMGGSGAGQVEMGIVMEEMGRALMCSPYLSTAVLAPNLLNAVDDAAERRNTLPRIAAGELIVGVAFAEGTSAWLPDHIETSARTVGDGWRLSGEKTFVVDALSADLLYVLAEADAGPTVFAVDRDTPGLEAEPLTTVDLTRKLGRVRFADTQARLIGSPGDGFAAMSAALDESAVALVSEQAGGAHRAMEMAAEYAKTRHQFGRAIGSFQAVKHMCADMLLEAESVLSAARHVASSFAGELPSRWADLALAQAYCSDAFVTVAATNIQVHGGIGFTWEHPAHLYLRRARSDAQLLGSPSFHRERYLQRIGA
jgi:alkylation response protein AidB-like acyl-CoA dehydrogenase